MKYEYKGIRRCDDSREQYVGRQREAVPDVESRINELGEAGWRLIHSENNGIGLTFAVMERVSGQDEAETQKERAKLARYIALPTSGGKWAVMDTTRRHNVNVSVWDTVMDATAEAVRLNMSGEGDEQ